MSLWGAIQRLALTDVTVLVKGLDRDTVERIEKVLVEADFGPIAFELVERLEAELRRGRVATAEQVRDHLRAELLRVVPEGRARDLDLGDGAGPGVVLVLGVNGAGKTTVIARLAHRLRSQGKQVLLAAADTFRAGASEQLEVWARRLDVPSVTGADGADPAAVAFDAIAAAETRGADAVLIDTAGRLHTHRGLLDELRKIHRVVGRRREGAPHEALLVLDGTVGQNALEQGRAFADAVPLTGLVVTKLDGTAKGGAVIRLWRELEHPIRFVGTGEGLADLELFDRDRFVDRLLED